MILPGASRFFLPCVFQISRNAQLPCRFEVKLRSQSNQFHFALAEPPRTFPRYY